MQWKTFCFDFLFDTAGFRVTKSLRHLFFVTVKRQNGLTNRVHIFCGTSHYPREGLWMVGIESIYLNFFLQNLKIVKTFYKFFRFLQNSWLNCITLYGS